jgi:hypothetical protein
MRIFIKMRMFPQYLGVLSDYRRIATWIEDSGDKAKAYSDVVKYIRDFLERYFQSQEPPKVSKPYQVMLIDFTKEIGAYFDYDVESTLAQISEIKTYESPLIDLGNPFTGYNPED